MVRGEMKALHQLMTYDANNFIANDDCCKTRDEHALAKQFSRFTNDVFSMAADSTLFSCACNPDKWVYPFGGIGMIGPLCSSFRRTEEHVRHLDGSVREIVSV